MPSKDNFEQAPEVAKIARELIKKHRLDLQYGRIAFLFTTKLPSKGGKTVLGKTYKTPELWASALGEEDEDTDFCMVITKDTWHDLTSAQQVALVDHELCHMMYNEAGNPKLVDHDISEFNEVIRRHGLWYDDVQRTARAMQDHLPGMEEVELESGTKTVDTETGEIVEPAAPAINQVTSASVTTRKPEKGEQKPRLKGKDGFGNDTPKRGAVPAGPQAPVGG